MIDPGKDIEKRAKAIVAFVNNGLKAFYKKAGAKGAKGAPAKGKGPLTDPFKIKLSTAKGSLARDGKRQAEGLLKGGTWTCNSSHMNTGARHLMLYSGNRWAKRLHQAKKAQKEAFTEFVRLMNASWNKQGVLNHSSRKGFVWNSGDPMHLELPKTRLKNSHKQVQICLNIYAKKTRFGGKAINTPYETKKGSRYQKDWLKKFDTRNYAKIKNKDIKAKIDELKAKKGGGP